MRFLLMKHLFIVGHEEKLKCDMYLLLLESKNSGRDDSKIENSGAEKGFAKPKLKPLDMPRFEGNIRDFPSFVEDYRRLVEPIYPRCPTVLKQCLASDALDLVRHRDSDFDKMMGLLQAEY